MKNTACLYQITQRTTPMMNETELNQQAELMIKTTFSPVHAPPPTMWRPSRTLERQSRVTTSAGGAPDRCVKEPTHRTCSGGSRAQARL